MEPRRYGKSFLLFGISAYLLYIAYVCGNEEYTPPVDHYILVAVLIFVIMLLLKFMSDDH